MALASSPFVLDAVRYPSETHMPTQRDEGRACSPINFYWSTQRVCRGIARRFITLRSATMILREASNSARSAYSMLCKKLQRS